MCFLFSLLWRSRRVLASVDTISDIESVRDEQMARCRRAVATPLDREKHLCLLDRKLEQVSNPSVDVNSGCPQSNRDERNNSHQSVRWILLKRFQISGVMLGKHLLFGSTKSHLMAV